VRHRVFRAFLALAAELISTGELVRRVWPRKQRFDPREYWRVRLAAAEIADPVERSKIRRSRLRERRCVVRVSARAPKDAAVLPRAAAGEAEAMTGGPKTRNGLDAFVCLSALQKCVRRVSRLPRQAKRTSGLLCGPEWGYT
jgi:hypothetical protein